MPRYLLLFMLAAYTIPVYAQGLSTTGVLWRRDAISYRDHYMDHFYRAKASGKDLNYFLRTEIGFGYTFGPAIFRVHNHYESPSNKFTFDTTFNLFIRPKHNILINELTGYPIVAMGDNAGLIFTYGISARFSRFDVDPITMGTYTTNFIFSNFDLGIPLGIDFKSGGEAMLDKTKRFCFTLGAGLEPIWVTSDMNRRHSYNRINIVPFAKAEVGFLTNFAGFKFRVNYLAGTYTYYQADDVANGSAIQVSKQSPITISLIILELVNKWDE